MKNTYFLKKTHFPVSVMLVMLYLLIVAMPVILQVFQDHTITLIRLAILVLGILITWLIIKFCCTTGLYINGENIIYKSIKTKEININSIKGIKISTAYYVGPCYIDLPFSDKYSAIMLKSITSEMYDHQSGDLMFLHEYQKYIICSVVYEKDAIEYLTTLNPNIKIIK